MAVAGIQINASSFHREPLSPLSRRRQGDRASSRASSILQIWRQIESEQLVSRSRSRVGDRLQQQRTEEASADFHNVDVPVRQESGCDSADENSCGSEQSSDIGEVERARVRQVFREWNHNGVVGDHPSDVSNSNSSSGTQCPGERVRVMRDSVRRGTCDGREEQGAIAEQVREGVDTNHCGFGAKRKIRRLCGRQALLDLLARAEKERKKELEDISQHRPVSNFAYRNRIQSSLRGRFLRTERLVVEERSTARATSELGVLRTKHTVSGLREGFRFRLDHVDPGSVSTTQTDTSSDNDTHDYRNEQTQTHTSTDVQIQGNSELGNDERHSFMAWTIHSKSTASSTQSDTSSNADINDYRTEQTQAVQETYEPHNDESNSNQSWTVPLQSIGQQEPACHEQRHNLENDLGINEVQESFNDIEDSAGQNLDNMELTWRENSTEGTDGTWRDNTVNTLYQEVSGSEGDGGQYLQELREEWIASERQETLDDLSEEPSIVAAPVISFSNTFYFPEDEDVYPTEIGELLSRRSVTNLLQSDFRQSLDLLIQSYAERRAQASFDDEGDIGIPSPGIVEPDVQQGGTNHQDSREDERAQFVISSPTVAFSQTFWEREFQSVRWPQISLHQDFGIEWETINDLRIDMAMLQQRMNGMQRMLEACMDMQIELQRSIRQEVSAALNRGSVSTGNKKNQPKDEPNWDSVRKGICCICSDNNINSLLYRCGHLCTCSGCAERLVKQKGKCPMCRAPVVEAVRAYTIQE